MNKEEPIILTASFNNKVCTYWLLNGIIVLTVIVVGIPFLLLWIPLGLYFTRRYLSRMECVLTEKNLKVKKGMWVRVEKTIPLEKITDLGLVQGPIMRHFDIHQLTVETAGQSSQGPLVSLTGIIDVKNFRETVLSQRDSLRDASAKTESSAAEPAGASDTGVLSEIRDTLLRIEEQMKKNSHS
jgi:putative membrane protein